MNKRRTRRRSTTLLVAFTLLLSGCQVVADPISLLRVPKLPEVQENLSSVVDQEIKKENGVLVRPINSKVNSAIQTGDIDGDGVGEAITFYKPEGVEGIHGMILKYDGSVWRKLTSFPGAGPNLDRVELVDFNEDNRTDIVVGYGPGDVELTKGLVVYSYIDSELTKMFEQPYSQFVIDDLNRDKKDELFIVNKRKDSPYELSMFGYKENTFVKRGELQLDSQAHNFNYVTSGFISKYKRGLVLDASTESNTGLTQVITLTENGKLKNILSEDLTYKANVIRSVDINADNIIEIASLEEPSGWELYEKYEIPYFTNYSQWDGNDGFQLVEKQYRDHQERFQFTIPRSWYGRVTIDTKSQVDEHIIFIDQFTNETLAEIRFFSVRSWERYKDKWLYLAAYGDQVIGINSKEVLDLKPKLPLEENKDAKTNK
ncbi:hypothetical protein [Paenibacillus sp. SC116]|uniref:hypothetical protein n=1 Tax=Paenibacillus sp. SC116 TaxID=2968986 RepID=UPI00215A6280|nr:hypothetical protein [Paenibacillus sp. SC116]